MPRVEIAIGLIALMLAAAAQAFYVPTAGFFQLPQTTVSSAPVSGWATGTTNVIQALAIQNQGVTIIIRFYYQPGDQGVLLGMAKNPVGGPGGAWTAFIYIGTDNVLRVGDWNGNDVQLSFSSLSAGWHTLVFSEYYSGGTYYIVASLDGNAPSSTSTTSVFQLFNTLMPYAYIGTGFAFTWPGASNLGWFSYTDQIAWVAAYPGYQSTLFGQAWETPPSGYAYLFSPAYYPSSTPSTSTPIAVVQPAAFTLWPGGSWYAVKPTSTQGMYVAFLPNTPNSYVYSIASPLASTSSSSATVSLPSGSTTSGVIAAVFYPTLNTNYYYNVQLSVSWSSSSTASITIYLYLYCRVLSSAGSYDYYTTASTSTSGTSGSYNVLVTIEIYGFTVCIGNAYLASNTTISVSETLVSTVSTYLPSSLPDKYGVSLQSPVGFNAYLLTTVPAVLKVFQGQSWGWGTFSLNGTSYFIAYPLGNGSSLLPANSSNYVWAPGSTHKYLPVNGATQLSLPGAITGYIYWPNPSTNTLSSTVTTYQLATTISGGTTCYLPGTSINYVIVLQSQGSAPSPVCYTPQGYAAALGSSYTYVPYPNGGTVSVSNGPIQYGIIQIPSNSYLFYPTTLAVLPTTLTAIGVYAPLTTTPQANDALAPHLYDWYLNGVNSYVQAPNPNPSYITVFARVMHYMPIPSNNPRIVSNGNPGLYNTGFYIGIMTTGNLYYGIGNGASNSFTVTSYYPPAKTWYVVMMTYNGTVNNLYVNNQLIYSKAISGTIAPTNLYLDIGVSAYLEQNSYWYGLISYLFIYNRTLTNTEINDIYNNNKIDNISKLMLFLDPTFYNGTKYIDLSGNGNNGVPYNVARVPVTVDGGQAWIWDIHGLYSDGNVHLRFFPYYSWLLLSNGTLVPMFRWRAAYCPSAVVDAAGMVEDCPTPPSAAQQIVGLAYSYHAPGVISIGSSYYRYYVSFLAPPGGLPTSTICPPRGFALAYGPSPPSLQVTQSCTTAYPGYLYYIVDPAPLQPAVAVLTQLMSTAIPTSPTYYTSISGLAFLSTHWSASTYVVPYSWGIFGATFYSLKQAAGTSGAALWVYGTSSSIQTGQGGIGIANATGSAVVSIGSTTSLSTYAKAAVAFAVYNVTSEVYGQVYGHCDVSLAPSPGQTTWFFILANATWAVAVNYTAYPSAGNPSVSLGTFAISPGYYVYVCGVYSTTPEITGLGTAQISVGTTSEGTSYAPGAQYALAYAPSPGTGIYVYPLSPYYVVYGYSSATTYGDLQNAVVNGTLSMPLFGGLAWPSASPPAGKYVVSAGSLTLVFEPAKMQARGVNAFPTSFVEALAVSGVSLSGGMYVTMGRFWLNETTASTYLLLYPFPSWASHLINATYLWIRANDTSRPMTTLQFVGFNGMQPRSVVFTATTYGYFGNVFGNYTTSTPVQYISFPSSTPPIYIMLNNTQGIPPMLANIFPIRYIFTYPTWTLLSVYASVQQASLSQWTGNFNFAIALPTANGYYALMSGGFYPPAPVQFNLYVPSFVVGQVASVLMSSIPPGTQCSEVLSIVNPLQVQVCLTVPQVVGGVSVTASVTQNAFTGTPGVYKPPLPIAVNGPSAVLVTGAVAALVVLFARKHQNLGAGLAIGAAVLTMVGIALWWAPLIGAGVVLFAVGLGIAASRR